MNPIQVIKRHLANVERSTQLLAEIRAGIANLPQENTQAGHLAEIREGVKNVASQIDRQTAKFSSVLGNGTIPASKTSNNLRLQSRQDQSFGSAGPSPKSASNSLSSGYSQAATASQEFRSDQVHDLSQYRDIFSALTPYAGTPPSGFFPDWLGSMTDLDFRNYFPVAGHVDGNFVQTRLPTIEEGEGWFEAVNQVEAARAARGRFVMITLGACYGAQAVGSYLALQKINPMPFKLVAVEPEPVNLEWVAKHFRDNGIDPDDQWLIGAAISDTNQPVFFPVGAPGSGAQNCFSTNEAAARANYVETLISSGQTEAALRSLLLHNTTGLTKRLMADDHDDAEISVMSAVTLGDVLSPFDVVDYLEVDIQQSEIIVFPPHMDLVTRKVRRVHLGTHGADVHRELVKLFEEQGWEIIFDFPPNETFQTTLGSFSTNDGVLSARNPHL